MIVVSRSRPLIATAIKMAITTTAMMPAMIHVDEPTLLVVVVVVELVPVVVVGALAFGWDCVWVPGLD